MEETVAKKQKSSSTSSVRPGSHPKGTTLTGTNGKTDIRIIHIFAPEIIKTDAANFRELVQRLTGKPSPAESPKKPKSRGGRGRIMRIPAESEDLRRKLGGRDMEPLRSIKLEVEEEAGGGVDGGEGVCWGPFRRPERTYSKSNSNHRSSSTGGGGGFLGEFVDLDHQYGGLMHGLGDEFPMLPLENVGGNVNTDDGDSDSDGAGLWPA